MLGCGKHIPEGYHYYTHHHSVYEKWQVHGGYKFASVTVGSAKRINYTMNGHRESPNVEASFNLHACTKTFYVGCKKVLHFH